MVGLNADIHPSLSEMILKNLRQKNVITIIDFVTTDSIKLTDFTGLSYMDILQVKQHISKIFSGSKKNVTKLLAIERNCIIRTNITRLDELLKGGLYPGQLCELCGSSSSGKTQLCLTIAANITMQPDIIVWYFDTKKDFSRLRYEEILKAKSFRKEEIIEDILQRTKVYHVYSIRDLIQSLRQLVTWCKTRQNIERIRNKSILVIIDSLTAIIFKVTRNAYQHKKDFETTYELENLAQVCRFLTVECQAIMVTVNSITQWDSFERMEGNITTPALGIQWARIPVTRLLITKQYDETRKITVLRDLRLENSSCVITITNAGIVS